MTFTDNSGDLQRVVYLEYWDGKPHCAVTDLVRLPGAASSWDIEKDCRDDDGFMFFESGGFGLKSGIEASGHYWAADDVVITKVAEGAVRLTTEPEDFFAAGREVFTLEYCKVCDAFYDEDWCPEHHKEKKSGGAGYRKGFRKRDGWKPSAEVSN